ncbi:hypothetical protein EX30DRAFT_367889 [Ascodesmis nigricans]|uniref:Dynamin-type G domain-containing protein n=1 Tax=Ascodesmis nigricans TaxID=341454 RepID=A0A4S2N684_9PEZI|nr:hypothetical protein EX30DRAFT_367889 [Ascodesmis nigricans]
MASQHAHRVATTVDAAATRIASDLHSDSGYGGSIIDGEQPAVILGNVNNGPQSEESRRQWASHVHQMAYNQNRVALGRSINRTVETLKGFQKMNSKWPAHYPAVQRPESTPLQRTQSTVQDSQGDFNPQPLRRAATTAEDHTKPAVSQPEEPRLVTPKIAEDFNVLKLDLKLGSLSPSELVHSLEKSSVASLLDGKISQSIKHLLSLRDRIEDTSSKVLITGDLNAGKSTFCNALLRKKVLPEDQQPCTSIFCEVLDARENSNIEEFHAIPLDGPAYNRNDETTYDAYPLEKLEEIVVENDRYHQVKVYVEDVRSIDQSLLRNGVVDIALIDAPGLNMDSIKTTAVFARQEEIDVVVFVVSAENHFTLSAKEFIWNAANEKAYIFIVVNRFDNIRDKARCRRMIMEQVAHLSPQTHADAHELVHFVSSNAVIEGTDAVKIKEFEELEQSLRSFVLDKRARSKLAPAKTYLMNLLGDLETLADVNKNTISAEIDRLKEAYNKIAPAFEKAVKARTQVSDEVERTIEETVNNVCKFTRRTVSEVISRIDESPSVAYEGILSAFAYAEATKNAMLSTIQNSVTKSEEHARKKTTQGVSSISALGLMHLGDEYVEKTFRADFMFSRKRHQLNRDIQINIDAFDFFDFDRQEKIAGAGTALTVASVAVPQIVGIQSWFDGVWKATNLIGVRNTRKLIIPAIALAAAAGAYFVISDIPNAVPRKLAKKIRQQLAEIDYVHVNADRIGKETRKVLKFPAEDLRSGFQRSIEKQGQTVEETKKTMKESEVAIKYFGNLLREAKAQRGAVGTLDLEGHSCSE